MHPDLALSLSQVRVADLHRDAAHQRLLRSTPPALPGSSAGVMARLLVLGSAAAGWVTASARRAAVQPAGDPACCPA